MTCQTAHTAPPVDTIVVSYCFAPYADTAGIVMAKRLQGLGQVDVISNALDTTHQIDPTLTALTAPFVHRHDLLQAKQGYDDPDAIIDFAMQSAASFAQNPRRGQYKTLYSRAMWPASHFAAALIKLQNPSLRWVAEFSDPLALAPSGVMRRRAISQDWLHDVGLKQQVAQGLPRSKPRERLFCWAEAVAYAAADTLIFTNNHQMQVMLGQRWIGPRRRTLAENAQVHAHPTLTPEFYGMGQGLPLDQRKLTIGYFGRFYSTRGLGDVLKALTQLDTVQREAIMLYVHCPNPIPLLLEARALGVENSLIVRPMLHYLDFLNTLGGFDFLLVNDAQTKGMFAQNPYLPSKVSDYLGARRPIFALVEHGSTLDKLPLPAGSQRCLLGNIEEYVDALRHFCARRLPSVDRELR